MMIHAAVLLSTLGDVHGAASVLIILSDDYIICIYTGNSCAVDNAIRYMNSAQRLHRGMLVTRVLGFQIGVNPNFCCGYRV